MPMTRAERIAARAARYAKRDARLAAAHDPVLAAEMRAMEFEASGQGRYEFRKHWFWEVTRTGEDPCRTLFKKWILPRRDEIHRYLEIGLCEGQSFIWMLENVVNRPGDFALGVDPYVASRRKLQEKSNADRETFCRNIKACMEHFRKERPNVPVPEVKCEFRCSQIVLAKLASQKATERDGEKLNWDAPDDRAFDMVFVDGDHRAAECLVDCALGFSLLRLGGIMVIDDMRKRWVRQRPFTYEGATGFLMAFEKRYEYLYRTPNQIGIIRTE